MADLILIAAVIAILWLCLQWGASFQGKPEKPKSQEQELGEAIRKIIDNLK